jgi:hypothetical protein
MGATDLIASGDWTVPREGGGGVIILFFRTNDVSADKHASGLVGLLFQSPFFHLLLCSGPSPPPPLGTSGV